MLRTPKKPVWVTIINRTWFGLLFSVNPELVRDWKMEHIFYLHYYTGLASQKSDALLTVGELSGQVWAVASPLRLVLNKTGFCTKSIGIAGQRSTMTPHRQGPYRVIDPLKVFLETEVESRIQGT